MFELPVAKGAFPCLWRPADWNPSSHWHHRLLLTPRTLTGWRTTCEDLRRTSFFGEVAPQVQIFKEGAAPRCPQRLMDGCLHPWGGRGVAAAFVEVALQKTQRVRWILRKALTRYLVAKARQRLVGDTMDLMTTEPVPRNQQVVVCDLPTRTTYVFHTLTINRVLHQALFHGLYGIPDPQKPRNPYTNVPWTLGQLAAIYTQITVNLAVSRNQTVSRYLTSFRRTTYDVEAFAEQNTQFLRLVVARAFFRDTTAYGWRLVYQETLDEIFEYLDLNTMFRDMLARILDRRLSTELQEAWDGVVLGFWFFQNYRTLPASVASSFPNLVEQTRNLHVLTLDALRALRPPIVRARRRGRPKNTDAPAEELAAVHIP